jgi:hypothetical protein
VSIDFQKLFSPRETGSFALAEEQLSRGWHRLCIVEEQSAKPLNQPTKPNPTKMKKLILTVALLGVALASWTPVASAHPGGCHPCYHPSYCWYPTYQDCDDDYSCHPHRHHCHVLFVP